MAEYSYAIGTAIDSLTNIEDLVTNFPAPRSKFFPFSVYVTLANKISFGRGRPTAEWRWGFLRNFEGEAFRDALRTYCPGASAVVFIRTMTNENLNEYKAYQAVMKWPEDEAQDARRRIDFVIQFTNMILTEEP